MVSLGTRPAVSWVKVHLTSTSSIRGLSCSLYYVTWLPSFAPVLISMTIRGRCLTVNIRMRLNNLLAHTTYTSFSWILFLNPCLFSSTDCCPISKPAFSKERSKYLEISCFCRFLWWFSRSWPVWTRQASQHAFLKLMVVQPQACNISLCYTGFVLQYFPDEEVQFMVVESTLRRLTGPAVYAGWNHICHAEQNLIQIRKKLRVKNIPIKFHVVMKKISLFIP